MTTLFAPSALMPDGWADNVIVEIDKDGWIVGVDAFKDPDIAKKNAEVLDGPLIPGMPNVHSRSFQRAMAGLTERAGGRKETFWNWRETMYRLSAQLSPDDIGALAAQVFVEMLKGGYTSVGEFHYIHNQQDGTPYKDPSQTSQAIVQAALSAGIELTLFPALYAYGGFGEKPPADGQKRFLNTVPSLMRIIEEVHGQYRNTPQISVGLAHHSLRAVSPEMLREATAAARLLIPDCPVHIHAAEYTAEVEGCLEWSGLRPVEWLLENTNIDDRWCVVHATHINSDETARLAQSGAIAGLCPMTEANLGGGIFPLLEFFHAGGWFAIGSGSNITISAKQELRWLEYIQRLVHRERKLIQSPEIPSVGGMLMDRTVAGGARAIGKKTGKIAAGYRADFVVLDTNLASMTGKVRDHVLDAAIFASNQNPVKHVMSGGKWAVRERKHKREDHVLENYRKVMESLT